MGIMGRSFLSAGQKAVLCCGGLCFPLSLVSALMSWLLGWLKDRLVPLGVEHMLVPAPPADRLGRRDAPDSRDTIRAVEADFARECGRDSREEQGKARQGRLKEVCHFSPCLPVCFWWV